MKSGRTLFIPKDIETPSRKTVAESGTWTSHDFKSRVNDLEKYHSLPWFWHHKLELDANKFRPIDFAVHQLPAFEIRKVKNSCKAKECETQSFLNAFCRKETTRKLWTLRLLSHAWKIWGFAALRTSPQSRSDSPGISQPYKREIALHSTESVFVPSSLPFHSTHTFGTTFLCPRVVTTDLRTPKQKP